MAKTVKATQAALVKARARRAAMDVARDARDRRVEAAAADVFLLLAERAEAKRHVVAVEAAIGAALQRVVQEEVGVPVTAELVELEVGEVRRLVKLAGEPPPRD